MSEDNIANISEETIASIVDAAQHIATDSDAMRRNLIRIADKLQPTIQQAGIEFVTTDGLEFSWNDGEGRNRQYYYRLAIVKIVERHLVIEEDYSQNENISIDEARMRDGTRYIKFADASRDDLEQVLHRLPAFISEYATELKRRHQKYADLRKMAEAIKEVVE